MGIIYKPLKYLTKALLLIVLILIFLLLLIFAGVSAIEFYLNEEEK